MLTLIPKPNIEILVVKVPEDANDFDVSNEHHVFSWQYPVQYRPNEIDAEDLPPGNWQFIATSKDISEEQAAELVENFERAYMGAFWKNYSTPNVLLKWPKQSLFSLIRSIGGDPVNKVYAILKNEG